MVLLLLLMLLGIVPMVEADAGDFHKWAVVVGTLVGSTVVLAILCFIIYYIFIKKWLDDYLSDPTHRQDVVHHSQPKAYAPPHQEKRNMWNSNNRNGVLPNGETKYYSDAGYDQYYGNGGFQTKTQSGNNQQQQSNTPAALNYQQAYQQATQSYNSQPSIGIGAQIAAHNNQFGLPPRSTTIAQDPYTPYILPSERQQQSANAYRAPTNTHRNQVLSAAYTGSSF